MVRGVGMWSGLRSRRWRVRAVACLVMVAALVCAGVAPRPAASDDPDQPASDGKTGVWPDHGDSLPNESGIKGTWRDGWCRRGEGYSVVVDLSDIPESWRGDLTPTPEHVKQYGPTVRDGWIVRCHQGPWTMDYDKPHEWPALEIDVESVGISTDLRSDYVQPEGTTKPLGIFEASLEILGVRNVANAKWKPHTNSGQNAYVFDNAIWIRPDARTGSLTGGWPPNQSLTDEPWPSKSNNRLVNTTVRLEGPISAGMVAYIGYDVAADCRFNVGDRDWSNRVCLGDAARHPRTYVGHPEWTLTPQYAQERPHPGPAPKPGPTSSGRAPHSGTQPRPHRRPHSGPQPHLGPGGHGGRRDVAGVHAGASVRRGGVPHARPSASVSVSPPASPSATASPSVSPSRSASPSPSMSAFGSASALPGGGRVWGSERQGPVASSGHRGVPSWAWGAGGAVLVAAGVLVWWLVRGRYRRREDDEIDFGDVE